MNDFISKHAKAKRMICIFLSYLVYLFILFYLLEMVVTDNTMVLWLFTFFFIFKWLYNFHCFFKILTYLVENKIQQYNRILSISFTMNSLFSIVDLLLFPFMKLYFYPLCFDFIFHLYNLLYLLYIKVHHGNELNDRETETFSGLEFSNYL